MKFYRLLKNTSFGPGARSILLGMLIAATLGCEDNAAHYHIRGSFLVPDAEGAKVDCTQDADVFAFGIQYNVTAMLDLDGLDPELLHATLAVMPANAGDSTADGGVSNASTPSEKLMDELWPAGIEGEISSNGRIDFKAVPLADGEQRLLFELTLDGRRVMRMARTVVVDSDRSICDEKEEIRFERPLNGVEISAADDLDHNLANGIQIDVALEVSGQIDGQVSLVLDENEPLSEKVVDKRAVFPGVTLPIELGAHQLSAFARTKQGTQLEATASLFVNPGQCEVKLSPESRGLCDVIPSDDLDLATPGLQIELTAETFCNEVVFTVNGHASDAIAVIDGRAVLRTTLEAGENAISASASTGNVTGQSDVLLLDARTTQPTLALNLAENALNRLGVEQMRALSDGERFVVAGSSSGLDLGSAIEMQFEPDVGSADVQLPSSVVSGIDGYFELPVSVTYACGSLSVRSKDLCGQLAVSPEYAVCFDSVVPAFALTAPNGDRITWASDTDPLHDDLQVPVTIHVDDSRPNNVDYIIDVVCGRIGDESHWNSRLDSRLRRSLVVDGTLSTFVNFAEADAGQLACKVTADSGLNGFTTESYVFSLAFGQASFQLQAPVFNNDLACFAGAFDVSGVGANLDASGAQMNARLVLADDPDSQPIDHAMTALGNEQYATSFEVIDGLYRLQVTGQSDEGEVAVTPSSWLSVRVDTVAPNLLLESPTPDDLTGNVGDMGCFDVALTLKAEDASATEICYKVNRSAEQCGHTDASGQLVTTPFLLHDGENQIELHAVDCAGNRSSKSFTLSPNGCAPRLEITSPLDGQLLAMAFDADTDTDGYQFDVKVDSALAEGAQVYVDVETNGETRRFGPATTDALGNAVVRVTVPVTGLESDDLSFRLNASSNDSNSGWLTASITFNRPSIALRDVSNCINLEFDDVSSDDGLQVALVGETSFVAVGQPATLKADCDQLHTEASGVVAADGSIDYSPLTLPDEGVCTLIAEVQDAAGQTAQTMQQVTIDRDAPSIFVTYPAVGQALTSSFDEQRMAAGMQVTPTVKVCGAGGRTALLSEASLGVREQAIPEGDCAQIQFDQVTFPSGNIEVTYSAQDACGNIGAVVAPYAVYSGSELRIISHANGDLVMSEQDADAEMDGCQLNLQALVGGFTTSAQFAVCTSASQGQGSELCNGRSDALRSDCSFRNNQLTCPISLMDGVHELQLIGVENGVQVASNSISLRADCSVPKAVSIAVLQDANDDGCLNRQERANATATSDEASYSLAFEVSGIEDGRMVDVYRDPGAVLIGSWPVENGRATTGTRSIASGSYTFYLAGTDSAGNAIPQPTDGGLRVPLVVDTSVPMPLLLDLAAEQCLNQQQDENTATAGFQRTFAALLTENPGEKIDVYLAVDDRAADVRTTYAQRVSFEQTSLSEGEHSLALWAVDACGNTGSAMGFERSSDGSDDWTRPLSMPFKVDTVAPHPVLGGLAENARLSADEDADHNAANGFQTDVTVAFASANDVEAGQTVRILSGGSAVSVMPNPLTVPESLSNALDARLTLPPGSHALSAQVADACGNVGESEALHVTVDIEGCVSQITTLNGVSPAQPSLFGPNDGAVSNATLAISVAGQVLFYEDACKDSTVQLMLDGTQSLASMPVRADGSVAFAQVFVPEGRHELSLLVTAGDQATPSQTQTVLIDLTAPQVSLLSPQEDDVIVEDLDINLPDQQIKVTIDLQETQVLSARAVQLFVNGTLISDSPMLDTASGAIDLAGLITLPAGENLVKVCAVDAVGNQTCDTALLNADPADPTEITDLTAEILDRRETRISLKFKAPEDDQNAEGINAHERVAYYQVFASTDEITEENIEDLTPHASFDATVDPGFEETLVVTGLKLNQLHHVAVRAVDDAERVSDLALIDVDLSLKTATYEIPVVMGQPWTEPSSAEFWSYASAVKGRGDFNGDGYPDLLIAGTQYDEADDNYFDSSAAILILGNENPDDASVVALEPPTLTLEGDAIASYAMAGVWAGDLNGDGADDIALLGATEGYAAFISIYLGCAGPCAAVPTAPSSVIYTENYIYLSEMFAAGNFIKSEGGTQYDDLLVATLDNAYSTLLIEGRAVWPAELDSSMDGFYAFLDAPFPDYSEVGTYSASLGDLNGDGIDDLVASVMVDPDSYRNKHGALLFGIDEIETAACQVSMDDVLNGEMPCNGLILQENECVKVFWGFLGNRDLNGDGRPEFLASDRTNKRVAVYGYDPETAELSLLDCQVGQTNYGRWIDWAGDINGDGQEDLLAIQSDEEYDDFYATVRYGNGQAQFGRGVFDYFDVDLNHSSKKLLGAAGAGDFNGDGLDDVSLIELDGNVLRVTLFY